MIDRHITVACLTPAGAGAIGSLLVSGAGVCEVVQRFLALDRTPLVERPCGAIVFAAWGGESGEHVVLCRRDATTIEIHGHGGTAALGRVLLDLVSAGAQPTDWTACCFAAPDLIRAEARVDLAAATTERCAALLLDQYRGALSQAVRNLVRQLDDSPEAAAEGIAELLRAAPVGLHTTAPWRVALVGAPNVGKSCLANALLGFDRAIVAPVPGTTRDTLSARTAFDGWPVEIIDTAGLRSSDDPLERQGMARTREAIASADLLLAVFDAGGEIAELESEIATGHRVLRVANKCDLVPEGTDRTDGSVRVSALTGAGLPRLIGELCERLVPRPPAPGAPVPFRSRHQELLVQAAAALAGKDVAAARTLLLEKLLGNQR